MLENLSEKNGFKRHIMHIDCTQFMVKSARLKKKQVLFRIPKLDTFEIFHIGNHELFIIG